MIHPRASRGQKPGCLTLLVSTIFLVMHPCTGFSEESDLRVMSFNIRYANRGDGPNRWEFRADTVATIIADHADVVGVQEALAQQVKGLADRLPGFRWVGVGRNNGRQSGEFAAIFYRDARFRLQQDSTFWLSETPDRVGSRGWDADLPRIVTRARLYDRNSNREFEFWNTHFDHVGRMARQNSARLILSRLQQDQFRLPVILTGDFNCREDSKPYQILADKTGTVRLVDARSISSKSPEGPNSTWNGFQKISAGQRIDFIWTSDKTPVLEHRILDVRTGTGRFASDHLPVQAVIRLP